MVKKQNQVHIGSTELVKLPYLGDGLIPAKVDTGADYSSIWASNIIELEGKLSFDFFGPNYKHYKKNAYKTEHYSITQVKNSFGQVEKRYVVKLPLVISGKKIRVLFRLSDRSKNRYPILIGKSTLKNRFIVDVSKNRVGLATNDVANILVFNSLYSDKYSKYFNKLNEKYTDINCTFKTYEDIYLILSNNDFELRNISDSSVYKSLDMIYFKTYFKRSSMAYAISKFAKAHGINFADSEVECSFAYSKLEQLVVLREQGINIPKTIAIYKKNFQLSYKYLQTQLGDKFVIKDALSERGENNHLVSNTDELLGTIRKFNNKSLLLIQEFIANKGDYRMIVLDKKIKLIISRKTSSANSHLNNTSKGGLAELISSHDMPSVSKTIAIKAAIALNREVAGVDVIMNTSNKKWYVLEVNNNPQLASGAFIDEKSKVLALFFKTYSRK